MWKYAKFKKPLMLFVDMIILVMCSIVVFYLSPRGNGTSSRDIIPVIPNLLLLYGCILLFQIVFKSYNTLWRFAESREYLVLICGVGLGAFLYAILVHLLNMHKISHLYVFATVMATVVAMMLLRFTYRAYRRVALLHSRAGKRRVAIIGAGSAGVALLGEIINNVDSPYSVAFFLDDDPYKINRHIDGIEIKGPISSLPQLLANNAGYLDEIIIAIPSMSNSRRKEIVDICNKTKLRVKILPSALDLMEGSKYDLMARVRAVSIDDLLGRDEVMLDVAGVNFLIKDKTVLVTGGGGSIGSELCRQIAAIGPKKLVILDIYENNAYDIQQEILATYGKDINLSVEIASVRDKEKIDRIFDKYKPNVVFHAAAHKHVPLMEDCPEEAVKNNVFGTWNTMQAAERSGVERFVLISTDKAVNPTNVMGATKRMCEMLLQSMRNSTTEFIAVRFGNVLGSNGSVIPLFKKQIEKGGPVTITDKRIIRYFMTIPEAAQLVIQAGAMAKKSEVFVLDMGAPVKILSLAENLITLSGLKPYEDINIVEIGLRPGEKLYEELLVKSDELIKTPNQKIFIEQQAEISRQWMDDALCALEKAIESCDNKLLVEELHRIVPTFMDPNKVNSEAMARGEL